MTDAFVYKAKGRAYGSKSSAIFVSEIRITELEHTEPHYEDEIIIETKWGRTAWRWRLAIEERDWRAFVLAEAARYTEEQQFPTQPKENDNGSN